MQKEEVNWDTGYLVQEWIDFVYSLVKENIKFSYFDNNELLPGSIPNYWNSDCSNLEEYFNKYFTTYGNWRNVFENNLDFSINYFENYSPYHPIFFDSNSSVFGTLFLKRGDFTLVTVIPGALFLLIYNNSVIDKFELVESTGYLRVDWKDDSLFETVVVVEEFQVIDDSRDETTGEITFEGGERFFKSFYIYWKTSCKHNCDDYSHFTGHHGDRQNTPARIITYFKNAENIAKINYDVIVSNENFINLSMDFKFLSHF